jgi:ketosteroid isomerase-like protein
MATAPPRAAAGTNGTRPAGCPGDDDAGRSAQEGSMQDSRSGVVTDATRDVVDGAYAAFGRRDLDTLLALLDPDVVWGEPDNPHIPSASTWRGIQGVVDWLRIGNETEAILALEPRRILVDGDVAAVIGSTRVMARPTGRQDETECVHLVTVTGGRVVRFREFFDTWFAAEAFRS